MKHVSDEITLERFNLIRIEANGANRHSHILQSV
jgi:hypothetical protein